jgi:transposase InsO family protein
VRDRDAVYGRDFVPRARRRGVETLPTPVRAPRANVIANPLIGRLRRECLDQMIVLHEAHPRALLKESVRYHNDARPRRTLALETQAGGARPAGHVRSRPVLGGLHHASERAA